jgi:hypothetical protein
MKKVTILLMTVGTLCGCKKALNVPDLSSYSTGTVWTSPQLVQAYVNEIYNETVFAFKDGGFGWGAQTDELYSNFGWCHESEYCLGEATPDNQSSSFPLNYSSTLNFWSTLYYTIGLENTFFQNISLLDTNGNLAEIQSLTGQVHFLRALSYFELLKRFGGVPLISQVFTANNTTFTQSRASWDSTMQFILNDLNVGLPLLPQASYVNSNNLQGTATVDAANALKCRLFLYAASPGYNPNPSPAEWDSCAAAAMAVINSGNYSLFGSSTNYGAIFTNFFNPEVILARVYSGTNYADRYNTCYRDLSPNGYNGYSAYNVLENVVEAFQMSDGSAFSWSNPAEAANPYANRDPRFYADILYNGAPFPNQGVLGTNGQPRPSFAQFWSDNASGVGGLDSKFSSLSPWNASQTGYTLLKFVDSAVNFNTAPNNTTNCQWILFRLGEIYLNYAEAEANLGNTGAALTYLNMIRSRAGMPAYASGTQAQLLTEIYQERRVELCFEGHRFFDLRRWGVTTAQEGSAPGLGIVITPTNPGAEIGYLTQPVPPPGTAFTYRVDTVQNRVWPAANAFMYYPIPRSETQVDPNIAQNPGYQ